MKVQQISSASNNQKSKVNFGNSYLELSKKALTEVAKANLEYSVGLGTKPSKIEMKFLRSTIDYIWTQIKDMHNFYKNNDKIKLIFEKDPKGLKVSYGREEETTLGKALWDTNSTPDKAAVFITNLKNSITEL